VIILAVHSTSAALSVAITENQVVLRESVLPPARKHLENLAPLIRDLTAELHLTVPAIDGFGVAIGPGSFSGTRVGLSTIKGMALALAKPVVGISSLGILAWQALKDGEYGAPVIDARRAEIYTALYRKSGDNVILLSEPMLMKTGEFAEHAEKVGDRLFLCGDPVLDHLVDSIPNVVRSPEISAPSAAACALMAYERIRSGDSDDLHLLSPLYIRRSDAEEKKRLN
jgi:tRNA threonylcarbamoyladenosine biosynthesis protein TsaB